MIWWIFLKNYLEIEWIYDKTKVQVYKLLFYLYNCMRITNGGDVLEENKDSGSKTIIQVIVSGGQVNISTDNGTVKANQNNEPKIVEKQIIIENKFKNYNQNPNGKSGESDDGTMLFGVLVLIFAAGLYVQYRWQILLGFVVISLLIELLTCMIYYKGKKNGILYDKNLKQIGIFNMVSVSLIPILIGIISSPIYNSKIDFAYLKQQIIANGSIQTYFTNPSGQYAMFQMVGLFFTGLFLIYIVWSDLYIIAVLNVAMEKKGQKFWKLLLKWTCGKSKEGGKHIKAGIILIAISVIMTIGILPYILSLIQQSSQI